MWIFFLIFPHLDITIAGHYYDPATHAFVGSYSKVLDFLHFFAMKFPIVFSIVIVLFLIASLFYDKLKIKHRKEILFVAVCLWIGPGLVVNVVFKDNWGRPRPAMVEQLGGDKIFQAPFVMSNQCGTNCSFPCGDASVGFWLFALMPLCISRRKKLLAFSLAIFAGGGLGWMRIAQGGHFFSDVIFCGIFVFITTWLVYWAMYRKKKIDL
jgi:lipid A 4'-phosphatase